MPTDFDHFRKIAEDPDPEFLCLPAWVRGYSAEMIRIATRPDGRLAKNAKLIAVLLRAHPDEHDMIERAVTMLLETTFLVERDGQLYIRNFAKGQQSQAAKKQAKYRGKRNDEALPNVTPRDSALPRVTTTGNTESQAVTPLKTRLEETRSDLPPPTPTTPEPTPEADRGGGGGDVGFTTTRWKPLPAPDAPIAERASRYVRDHGARTDMGEPSTWPEVRQVLDRYAQRWPAKVIQPRSYRADARIRCLVDRLAEGVSPAELEACLIAASEAAKAGKLDDKYQRLDAILANPGQVDRWLSDAPDRIKASLGLATAKPPRSQPQAATSVSRGSDGSDRERPRARRSGGLTAIGSGFGLGGAS